MPQIVTFTGQEAHTSYGAKGFAFLINQETGQDTPIYDKASGATLVDQKWYDVQNGRWVQCVYEVPEGTVLKLWAVDTYKNHPNGGGGIYLRVTATADWTTFEGGAYQWRAGRVTGQVVALSAEEVAFIGVVIDAKQKRWYKTGCVTQRAVTADDYKGTEAPAGASVPSVEG